MKDIFRQASLDKLSSPEQLDRLVRLTSRRSWMGIAFFVIILSSLVIWGVTGAIPKRYNGQGILMSSGGTALIQSKSSGILSDVSVEKGDYVHPGDVIARIKQDDVIKEIERLKSELDQTKRKNIKQYSDEIEKQQLEKEKQVREIEKQDMEIKNCLAEMRKSKSDLEKAKDILIKKRGLLSAGAISKAEVDEAISVKEQALMLYENAIVVYEQAKHNKNNLEISLQQIINTIETLENELSNNEEVKSLDNQIAQYKEKLNESNILSPDQGKILAINIENNSMVQAGQVVAVILKKGKEVNDTGLIFYLPIQQGKVLMPGMKVNVYPSIYNRQEYGHMEAVVTEVSEYAAGVKEIRDTLGSDELTNEFMKMGVLLEVKANLTKDENTASGFYWSSKKGSTLEIDEGTICSVSVTVEENRPISLVIPLLKEKLLP